MPQVFTERLDTKDDNNKSRVLLEVRTSLTAEDTRAKSVRFTSMACKTSEAAVSCEGAGNGVLPASHRRESGFRVSP